MRKKKGAFDNFAFVALRHFGQTWCLLFSRLLEDYYDYSISLISASSVFSGVVVSVPMHVSESGDEGLGSMSPEPLSVITVTTEGHSVVNPDVEQLKRQLERERHARVHLEKQMRAIQSQLYPERFRDNQLIAYQPHEVTFLFGIAFINHLGSEVETERVCKNKLILLQF